MPPRPPLPPLPVWKVHCSTISPLLLTTNRPKEPPPPRPPTPEVPPQPPAPPPPPAPPVVPALPRGGEATEHDSLRQMLERHREDPACAACHRRMDPLGFALEPFDAVGRPRYRAEGVPVDASAELPDGTRFDGPAGLRDLLLGARRPDFIRSLLRHLSMYALGRGLDPIDDAWLEPALAELGDDPTLREMLLAVIESPPFLHRFPARPGDDA